MANDCDLICAQSLINKLPTDGTWARYQFVTVTEIPGEETIRAESDCIIRCVETVKDKKTGKTKRWIELTFKDNDPARGSIVYKFLVDEAKIENRGLCFVKDTTKYFRTVVGPNGKQTYDFSKKKTAVVFMPQFFPGKLDDLQDLQSKSFRVQNKTLRCTGISGSKIHDKFYDHEEWLEYKIYSNQKSPFGTVRFDCTVDSFQEGKLLNRTTLSLQLKSVED